MEKKSSTPAVSIPIQQAKQLIELYRNIEAADAHFKSCQSELFRNHMRAVYQAPLVAGAFEALQKTLSEAR